MFSFNSAFCGWRSYEDWLYVKNLFVSGDIDNLKLALDKLIVWRLRIDNPSYVEIAIRLSESIIMVDKLKKTEEKLNPSEIGRIQEFLVIFKKYFGKGMQYINEYLYLKLKDEENLKLLSDEFINEIIPIIYRFVCENIFEKYDSKYKNGMKTIKDQIIQIISSDSASLPKGSMIEICSYVPKIVFDLFLTHEFFKGEEKAENSLKLIRIIRLIYEKHPKMPIAMSHLAACILIEQKPGIEECITLFLSENLIIQSILDDYKNPDYYIPVPVGTILGKPHTNLRLIADQVYLEGEGVDVY